MTIEAITEQQFASKIDASSVTLVDFTSPYCPPCKVLLPILEQLDEQFTSPKFGILKVNVDESPAIASEFGIMGVPTVIVFKDGQPVEKLVGLRPKAAYQATISRYLSEA
jgi:thioredoxin 1